MSQIAAGWGAGPSARYDALAGKFRPVFQSLSEGASNRERSREMPFAEIETLKDAGFTKVRLPEDQGGFGATLPELFNLLIELSAADSNLTQILRVHFAFVEDVLNSRSEARRSIWLKRIAAGELMGVAWTEPGGIGDQIFSTMLRLTQDGLRLDGQKFYTTGTLFADWIDVGASDENGTNLSVVVRKEAPGVEVVDDWDGFGQKLTASGSTFFRNVPVEAENVLKDEERFLYGTSFYQLYHLATLAGIGRSLVRESAQLVADRRRTFSHAAAALPKLDPQVLQVIGKLRAQAYAAGAITLKAAEALQRAFETRFPANESDEDAAVAVAEIESAQAQSIVTDLILDASTRLFDALSASHTRMTIGLDRHWRNARTLASHNPRIYKDRIIGDFEVNGTPPPYQWRIGVRTPT
jgi:alkylation response protein AidB-like acyl-CoA dehydrogenase